MADSSIFSRIGDWIARRRAPLVPVVRLAGVIGQVGPFRAGLTLTGLAPVLERAFSMRHAKAVALVVNSPGGSPVQSALIHKRIRDLATEKKLPVLVFVEDVAASGGYWLACAGDEIFADENSILGSIGVITAGFGFPDLLEKIGVERRVYTAGKSKSMLDPFKPENPEDIARLRAIQEEMHASFRALVESRRGERLHPGETELFDGSFWTGRTAVSLGLADGLGDLRGLLRARFGDKVRLRPVGMRRPLLSFRAGGAVRMANSAGNWAGALPEAAMGAAEERALWARYGL